MVSIKGKKILGDFATAYGHSIICLVAFGVNIHDYDINLRIILNRAHQNIIRDENDIQDPYIRITQRISQSDNFFKF